MPKRDFRQMPQRVAFSTGREPATAAMLSVIPGLGQFYNGQSVKGFLFMDVAAVNGILLLIVLFAQPMADGIRTMLTGNHVKPNDGVLQALASAHLGTPFSLVLLSMILLFVGFAVRDAYDFARGEKLKPIYADSALHLSEAASGSYLFHFAAMMSCAIFALFFLIPKPELRQVTEIVFTSSSPPDVAPIKAKKFSDENSSARHREKTVEKPTPPTSTASQPRQQRTLPAHERTAAVPKETTPVKQAVKEPPTRGEQPPAAKPMPKAFTPAPTHPTPAPTPTPAPAPQTMAAKPAPPTPQANVTPMPTQLKQAASTSVAPPVVAMLPQSAAGFAPVPMALTHAASTALGGGPQPGQAKSNSARTASNGPPAPVSVTSSGGSGNTPAPVVGAHTSEPGHSNNASDMAMAPKRIAATAPNGGGMVHPTVGSPTSSAPRLDSRGSDTETGRGKNGENAIKVDFGPYMTELQRRIKRNWQPPKDPNSRQVVVEFTVFKSGELGSVRLSKSSGLSVNDQAAIGAIRAAAPFMPLPKGADESVDIQFTFDYRVFGGHASSF